MLLKASYDFQPSDSAWFIRSSPTQHPLVAIPRCPEAEMSKSRLAHEIRTHSTTDHSSTRSEELPLRANQRAKERSRK
jgi:hypothetical protein